MYSLILKEINDYFNQLTGYLVISVFLIALGLVVWVFPDTSVLNYGFADLEVLFNSGPYVLMFLAPAITMKMLAEERRSGTWELLVTAPIRPVQIVFSKFIASFLVLILALIPTLIYYYSIYKLGSPEGNIDSAGFFGAYVGMLLIGGVFTALGIFSSAITKNQVSAFIIAAFLCFAAYFGFSALTSLWELSRGAYLLDSLSLSFHYEQMSRGVISSGNLYYFIGSIMLLILLATMMIRKR
ncbi:gliding motility-associated ABC transporter permease subunit GldF [Echinicola pacifica]|uniref:Gliding motility-associated ABC transporter permease subunit GldF n=1 Tax=Echinicola pacifica TaxID=346377 RepID=A0A918Q9R0_9BACT|nr:ABC transporter permease subunit [Echinicola pacifica]GGZ36254.1 gliding motility-associated ABC transporter permease subunit GldF [Echinicola pacifica]